MSIFEKEPFQAVEQIMQLITTTFGDNCEVVLHDWSKGYEHSIVSIKNGHVTGRKVGGPGSNLGLELMQGTFSEDRRNKYNYVTRTPDGKILRSSTTYFTNEQGDPYGALCINVDIGAYIQASEALASLIGDYASAEERTPEFHARDVSELTDYLVSEALAIKDMPVSEMTKEDKIDVIRYLDEHGFFLITKSGDHICDILGISKYLLYNCLNIIRSGK